MQARGLGNDVDARDPAAFEGKPEGAEQASAQRHDDADGAVDERGLREPDGTREGERTFRPRFRAANFDRPARRRRRGVDADDEVGIEHCEQPVTDASEVDDELIAWARRAVRVG